MSQFVIYKPNDETTAIYLDNIYVGGANHDSDGWHGMEQLEGIVKQIANNLGIPLETKYEDEPTHD